MVDHANYDAYTWPQILEALWGGLPPAEAKVLEKGKDGSTSIVEFNGALSLSDPSSMWNLATKIEEIRRAVHIAEEGITRVFRYLRDNWQGPAGDAMHHIGELLTIYLRDVLEVLYRPYGWRYSLEFAGNTLDWARKMTNESYAAGFVYHPSSQTTVFVPAKPGGKGSSNGPGGHDDHGHYETQGVPAHYTWDEELAARHGRRVVGATALTYQQLDVNFVPLPLPPDLGELPSSVQEKKEAKQKQEELEKKQEEQEEKADKLQKENEAKIEQQEEEFKKAQADQQAEFDKALETKQEEFDKLKAEPPGGGVPLPPPGGPGGALDPPGNLDKGLLTDPGAPLGAEGFGAPCAPGAPLPLPGLGGVPVRGGFDLTGDGEPDLDEMGRPLPGFGTKVPGGIDISGDGEPDIDENGKPLPGGDFSRLPLGGLPFAPPGGRVGPFGSDLGMPPANPLAGPGGGAGAPRGTVDPLFGGPLGGGAAGTGKPFVRQPAIGGGFPAGDVDGAGLPKPGGAAAGPSGRLGGPGGVEAGGALARGAVAGFGVPGAGAGMAGYGYPPPMGGMGGMGAGGQQQNERDRQTWLLEDDEVWADDAEAPTSVLGRPTADEDEDEYAPQF